MSCFECVQSVPQIVIIGIVWIIRVAAVKGRDHVHAEEASRPAVYNANERAFCHLNGDAVLGVDDSSVHAHLFV